MNTVAKQMIAGHLVSGLLVSGESEMPDEFSYHLLRYALDDYAKNISLLNLEQYHKVFLKAAKSFELESRVLNSPQAKNISVPWKQLEQSLADVASRYQSRTAYVNDLESNFMDEVILRKALHRELLFDMVMQKISAQAAEVKDVDVELFYEMHKERFETPEKRLASHILITINPDFPENTHAAALAKSKEILARLNDQTKLFPDLAKRYSECPTAMQGGKLGEVQRGQLYPELDSKLFQLAENEISSIVESELGLHILICEKIMPRKSIPLDKVKAKIREILQIRNQRSSQKNWLANLQNDHPQ